jgi:hypothetical protein
MSARPLLRALGVWGVALMVAPAAVAALIPARPGAEDQALSVVPRTPPPVYVSRPVLVAGGGGVLAAWGEASVEEGSHVVWRRLGPSGGLAGPAHVEAQSGHFGFDLAWSPRPTVVWHPGAREFLLVFVYRPDPVYAFEVVDVYGQRVAPDGEPIGNAFSMTVGGTAVLAADPDRGYLAVWDADSPTVAGTRIVYAQMLDRNGAAVAPVAVLDDGVLSHLNRYSYRLPRAWPIPLDVVWNPQAAEFLAVWGVRGIRARRVSAAGEPVGGVVLVSPQWELSARGSYRAREPAVAWSSHAGEYLVVWRAETDPRVAQDRWEIFGQRLDASAREVGRNDFRISTDGPDRDRNRYAAQAPDVLARPGGGFLVSWHRSPRQPYAALRARVLADFDSTVDPWIRELVPQLYVTGANAFAPRADALLSAWVGNAIGSAVYLRARGPSLLEARSPGRLRAETIAAVKLGLTCKRQCRIDVAVQFEAPHEGRAVGLITTRLTLLRRQPAGVTLELPARLRRQIRALAMKGARVSARIQLKADFDDGSHETLIRRIPVVA